MILLITHFKLRKKAIVVLFFNLLRVVENDNFLYIPILKVPVFKDDP